MKMPFLRQMAVAALIAASGSVALVRAQQGGLGAADRQRRIDMEAELQSLASSNGSSTRSR